jgi:hypothetical protein
MSRWILPASMFAGTLVVPALAQPISTAGANLLPAPPPDSICTLAASPRASSLSIPASHRAGATGAATASFDVNFIDASAEDPWPDEVKAAFQYALDIWSTHLESTVPISIDATWAGLGGCDLMQGVVLGTAGPTFFVSDFGAGEPDTFYPIAQVEAMIGTNFVPGSSDIVARFNRACDDPGSELWYFGTDASPGPDRIDFVSVVLHEIGHGLGFVGTADVDDGAGSGGAIECDGIAGHGCFATPPGIYDRFATNASRGGTPFLESASYPTNSAPLGNALLGQTGSGLFFDGPAARAAGEGDALRLYSPSEWDAGSSFSHLDEDTYDGTVHALMTPSLNSEEAIHLPGPATCAVLLDMGWPLGSDCLDLLPVELTAFAAVADGDRVRLAWTTAGETNNAGFEIHHRTDAGDFRRIGFSAGAGTSADPRDYTFDTPPLAPGRHWFRLRQVDFDGAFAWSRTVEAIVRASSPLAVSAPFPNPFNPTAQFEVSVSTGQFVRIGLYDLLGARVLALHEGSLEPDRAYAFTVDAGALPSGVYFVHVEGVDSREVKTVMLLQ